MSGARRCALLILAILAVVAALALSAVQRQPDKRASAAERPALLLLTSLPLMFSEDFSLEGGGSEILKRLQDRYRLVPISASSAPELAKGRLLLMAQPLAQVPENLVALDNWVRAGGNALLLADPLLEWPSKRPLGDPLRPPLMFADTGLLGHWGLRLDGPDQRGPAVRTLGSFRVVTMSPGALHGGCAISSDRLVADCIIGKGHAVIVADADLINVADFGPEARNNLPAVIDQLAKLGNR